MHSLTLENYFQVQEELGSVTLDAFRTINGYNRKAFYSIIRQRFMRRTDKGYWKPNERYNNYFKRRGGTTWGIKLDSQEEFITLFGTIIEQYMIAEANIERILNARHSEG